MIILKKAIGAEEWYFIGRYATLGWKHSGIFWYILEDICKNFELLKSSVFIQIICINPIMQLISACHHGIQKKLRRAVKYLRKKENGNVVELNRQCKLLLILFILKFVHAFSKFCFKPFGTLHSWNQISIRQHAMNIAHTHH